MIDINPVSKAKRILNFTIDIFIWQIFTFLVIIAFVISDLVFATEHWVEEDVVFKLSYLISFWAYFFCFEYFFNRTIGKMITRTKVVDEFGSRPTAKSIFIRTLIRKIPIEYLSFIYSKNGHHDVISRTRVVSLKFPAN